MIIGWLFLAFFVLLGLSMPIGIAILVVCVGYILLTGGMQASFFISAFFSALDSFPLLAVPLFMLSGDLMTKGGIARQLFDLAHKLVGKLPGGHAMAAVLSCLFFGAVSGSAPATVAAIGGLMIPMLADIGYDRKWATGLLASAGALGVMIPPSIPMVMYGVVTGESVSDLFIAGIIPGILVGLLLCVYCYTYCKKCRPTLKWEVEEKSFGRVLNDSKWAILMPVIILGGIYSGLFTPTEAAAISVLYGLIICLFVTKTIKLAELAALFKSTAASMGPLMIVCASAPVLGKILTMERAPEVIANLILSISSNKIMIFLLVNLFLLIVGALMDTVAAILIFAPVLYPIMTGLGMSGIQFGCLMTVNLAVGFITPPIGMNLYVASGLTGLSVVEISKKIVVPMLLMIIAVLMVTYIPGISLCLLPG